MIKYFKKMTSKKTTFLCGICLSTETAAKSISIGKCQTHVFCSDCIAQYVKQKIESNKLDINCPMYRCPVILSHSEVLVLIDKIFRQDNELIKKKYIRFWEMNTDPNYRECSICGSHLRFKLDQSGETKCKCGRVSCFIHGSIHPYQTCAQYEQSLVKQKGYQLSINKISKIAKKCPGCKVPTERNGGCDHMRCSQCGQCWWWKSNLPGINTPTDIEIMVVFFVLLFLFIVWLCCLKK